MTFSEFTRIWGGREATAAALGVSLSAVKCWPHRGSIPAKYDARIIEASREAGHTLTPNDLHNLRLRLAKGAGK